jgi:hypothetical protein
MKKTTILYTTLAAMAVTSNACYEPDSRASSDESGESGDAEESGNDTDADDDDGPITDTSNDDDSGSDTGEPMPMPGNAMIRIIHGAPDAPNVDIYVEGSDEPAVSDLAYGETSEWLEVPAGDYNFLVRPAGASALDTPVYETGELTLPEGAMISGLAAGLLDTMSNNQFRVIPLVEGFEDAAAGTARVRIVHAGSDAPAVDIDVGNDGSDELTTINRFTETGAAGVELPAGEALQLGIRVDGQTVTAFTTPALEDGAQITVIATGLLGKLARERDGFSLLAVGNDGSIGFLRQNPVVYALHAGPDAPEVDVCTGDLMIASHLYFGTMKGMQVPPGAYDLDVYAAPSGCAGTAATSRTTPELEAGERYLIAATGEIAPVTGEPPLQLVTFAEQFSLDAGDDATFRIVHGASAPDVDVGVVTGGLIEDGNVLANGLKWPNSSDEIQVQPLTYQVGLAAAGGAMPLHPIVDFHVPVGAGFRGWVIAAGDAFPDATEHPIELIAVDTSVSPWTATRLSSN